MLEAKTGDKIEILHMKGEPDYTFRVGTVTHIDGIGQLHGTWGALAIIPEVDNYQITQRRDMKL